MSWTQFIIVNIKVHTQYKHKTLFLKEQHFHYKLPDEVCDMNEK
jgi:hypothetical protein